MKIYYIFFIAIIAVVVSGCTNQNKINPDNNLVIVDEGFCIAHTESNISSDEAYGLAKDSECATAGNLQEDCSCDPETYICTFEIKTDQPDCSPVCLVNLKTSESKIDWRCNTDSQ